MIQLRAAMSLTVCVGMLGIRVSAAEDSKLSSCEATCRGGMIGKRVDPTAWQPEPTRTDFAKAEPALVARVMSYMRLRLDGDIDGIAQFYAPRRGESAEELRAVLWSLLGAERLACAEPLAIEDATEPGLKLVTIRVGLPAAAGEKAGVCRESAVFTTWRRRFGKWRVVLPRMTFGAGPPEEN